MGQEISNLVQGILYVDGASEVGNVAELTLPEFAERTVEHNTIGLIGTPMLPTGQKNALEASVTLNALVADTTAWAADTLSTRNFIVRGNLQIKDAGGLVEQPVVYSMVGRVTNHNFGSYNGSEKNQPEISFTVDSIKIEINNVVVLDYDIAANKYLVNGTDIYAQRNQNLGIT